MATQPTPRYSPAEYLAFERSHALRHEFLAGEVYAMSGASRAHNLIVSNLSRELGNHIKHGPCDIYTNDMRVQANFDAYFYPDIVVACGKQQFADAEVDTLVNPVLIVEVLSPSTERFDRGTKFARYRQIDSLREYVLIDSTQRHVESFVRQADGSWLLHEWYDPAGEVRFSAIDCRVAMADVYYNVEM